MKKLCPLVSLTNDTLGVVDPKTEPTFTGQQAADAQTALRKALGLPPGHFPLPAFVGMVSDQIEQLRAAGKTDDQSAALIADAIGVHVPATAIADFYASPEARGHHGE